MEPVVHFSDEILALGTWHNLLVVDMFGRYIASHVEEMRRVREPLAARCPEGIVVLSFARPGTAVPDKETRARTSELIKSGIARHRISVTVMEETGVVAAAMRATARAITTLGGMHRSKIVATLDQAVPLVLPELVGHGGPPPDEAGLRAAVAKVRAAFRP
jgi:hypothetical protein